MTSTRTEWQQSINNKFALEQLIHSDAAKIESFFGVCKQILQEQSLKMWVDQNFTTLKEAEETTMRAAQTQFFAQFQMVLAHLESLNTYNNRKNAATSYFDFLLQKKQHLVIYFWVVGLGFST